MSISIKGMNKATVLAALYNASRPQMAGFLQYDPKPMTTEEAESLLKQTTDFDYLQGRVMKIDLAGDDLETWCYNRDNGQDAAENVINALRNSGDPNSIEVQAMHEVGKEAAADDVMEHIHESSKVARDGGDISVRLGLAGLADHLIPAVDKARSRSKH
jgi:hypothetical protein